jgi:hypothetical protein
MIGVAAALRHHLTFRTPKQRRDSPSPHSPLPYTLRMRLRRFRLLNRPC